MKVRCLIVDDESPATELLASYVQRIEDFEITGICHNALDAFTFLQKNPVDLVFLDIQMPRMSGLELVRSLPEKPANADMEKQTNDPSPTFWEFIISM